MSTVIPMSGLKVAIDPVLRKFGDFDQLPELVQDLGGSIVASADEASVLLDEAGLTIRSQCAAFAYWDFKAFHRHCLMLRKAQQFQMERNGSQAGQ